MNIYYVNSCVLRFRDGKWKMHFLNSASLAPFVSKVYALPIFIVQIRQHLSQNYRYNSNLLTTVYV